MKTRKQKEKVLKSITKLGFSEDDIIDAADAILDKLTINQLLGRDQDGETRVVTESPKKAKEEVKKDKKQRAKSKKRLRKRYGG